MLLYADDEDQPTSYDALAEAARSRAHGQLTVRVTVAPGLRTDGLLLSVVQDSRDEFRQMYGARRRSLSHPARRLRGAAPRPGERPELLAQLALAFRT
ncbi:hypothetical protein [Streptomyces sp. NPDC048516]|uniref:hypothetical protein n=1 Tax=Streptomyces sp. NPDC048516 TaxID=3365565 RepID=UPI003718F7B8